MNPSKTRSPLLSGALCFTFGASVGIAADVTLVVDNQSWLNANVWSDSLAPSVANDYFLAAVGTGIVRTSPEGTTAGGATDFPGNSLTVVPGSRLLIKQETDETASINGGAGNLIVDGGQVSFGANTAGGPHNNFLDVNELQITSTAGAMVDVNIGASVATIDGTLTGSGNLLIAYSNAGTSTGRTLSISAVDPAYAATITVTEGVILDFGSDLDFAGSLRLEGTSILNVDQNITIEGGKLVAGGNFVSGGVYTGAAITGLGANFIDGGGTLTVTASDSDNDGLNDFWEDRYFGDNSGTIEPSDLTGARGTEAQDPALGANWDNDSDGADNEAEESAGTDPTVADTDADGLDDGPELDGSLNSYGVFGDFVGVGNGGLPSDPLDNDSDDDGILDGEEVLAGVDGFVTNPNEEDTDFDDLRDLWEVDNDLDPSDSSGDNGGFGDPDMDDLENFDEQVLMTDPQDSDTDDDNVSDGDEYFGEVNVWFLGTPDGPPGDPTNPLEPDSDGDGLDDGEEATLLTDPNNPDTDGDGFSDSLEVAKGTSPTDDSDVPTDLIAVTASVAGITGPDTASGPSGLLFSTPDFDLAGGNAVALVLTYESATVPTTLSATFAGQAMMSATATQGAQTSAIFYLVDPAATVGAFEVTTDPDLTGFQIAYSQVALSNVSGVSTTASATSTSSSNGTPLEVSYTTGSDFEFVLSAAVNNDFNNARSLSVSYGVPDTDLLSHTLVGSSGHFHTYGRAGVAGEQTDGYFGQYQRTAIVSVAFGVPAAAPNDIRLVSAGFNGEAFEVTYEGLDNLTSYQLERSAPGLDGFESVGFPIIPATSTETFSDPAPPEGKAFYRLSFPD